jgi:signal peptidase I
MKLEKKIIAKIGIGLFLGLVSFIILIAAILFFVSPIEIEGFSMSPHYNDGEIWIMKKHSDINNGEVVVYENKNILLIKRIIASEGDSIKIKDGIVYVNDIVLEEEYLSAEQSTLLPIDGLELIEEGISKQVPENSYFLMGDNRENSFDSRFISVGFIKKEDIKGVIWKKLK